MKKRVWDEGWETERWEWEREKDIKSRDLDLDLRVGLSDERQRRGGVFFKRKAQGREMRVRDLLVLKWLDMFLSVLISGCCGGAGGKGGVEVHSNLLHKQWTELAVSQPAFNSTVISNPLHKSMLFCTHLSCKATAACTWKDKTRGRWKGDSHPSFCFLSLFPFLSFTHLHQPLSLYIESGEIKRKGGGKKKQVPGKKKKRTIKGGRGGAATFESITS